MRNVRKNYLGGTRNPRIWTSPVLKFFTKIINFHMSTGQTKTPVILQTPNSIAGKIDKSHLIKHY